MNKRVVIIHGYEGSPNDCWIPSLAKALRERGFEVAVPKMPNPSHPRLEKWIAAIRESIHKPDSSTYFVGHSLGCIAILQYLSSLPAASRAGGCIFVAGFIESLGIQEIEEFTGKNLDLQKIKQSVKSIVMITSDNDEEIPQNISEKMAKNLDAKLIIENGKGHFDDDAKVFELPSALHSIGEMSG